MSVMLSFCTFRPGHLLDLLARLNIFAISQLCKSLWSLSAFFLLLCGCAAMRGHQGPGSPQQRGKRNSQRQLEAKLSRRKSPRPLRQGLIAIRYTAIYVANRVVDPETGTWNLADNFSVDRQSAASANAASKLPQLRVPGCERHFTCPSTRYAAR